MIRFFVLTLFLFLLNCWNQQTLASSIFNFTSKKIYYTATQPTQTGKIKADSIETVAYQNKTDLKIYRGSALKQLVCQITLTENFDVFVHPYGIDHMACQKRAGRLPKE